MATNVSYLVDTATQADEYETFAAWWAAIDADLVTAGNIEKLVIQKTGLHWESGGIDLDGKTTDADNYVWITVDPAYRHDGTQASGFYISGDPGVNLPAFSINQAYSLVEYLDCENTRSGGLCNAFSAYAQGAKLKACIGKCVDTHTFYIGSAELTDFPEAHACMALGGNYGFGTRLNTRQRLKCYNCLAVGCNYGFDGNGSNTALLAINCCAFSSIVADWFGSFWDASSDYNATSDATTAPGANSITGIATSDFENAVSGDWHLTTGSALIGAGTSLSGIVDFDIDGEAYSTSWEIGPDYFAAGAPAIFTLSAQEAEDSFVGTVVNVDSIDFDLDVTDAQDTFAAAIAIGGDTPVPTITSIYVTDISAGQYDVYIDMTYPSPGGDVIYSSNDLIADNWLVANEAVITSSTEFTLDDKVSSNITTKPFDIANGYTYTFYLTISAQSGSQSFTLAFVNFSGNRILYSEQFTVNETPQTVQMSFYLFGDTETSGRVRIANTEYEFKDLVFESLEVKEAFGNG